LRLIIEQAEMTGEYRLVTFGHSSVELPMLLASGTGSSSAT
jgi:hypothetical protein